MNQKKDNGGKAVWRVMYPILIYFGISYIVSILATILAMTVGIIQIKVTGGALDYQSLLSQTTVILAQYSYEIASVTSLIMLPVVWFLFLGDRKEEGSEYRKYDRIPAVYYLVVFVLGIAASLAVNNMMNISGLMGDYTENLNQVAEQLYRGQLAAELIGIGILSPITEEILFRGLIMGRMKAFCSPNTAIVMSSILFALYHGNFLQFVYALILGLIFAYVYDKFHNLKAPILVHCGANLISVIGSETALLDRFYQTEMSVMAGTMIWCLVILGCIYIIHYRLKLVKLHPEKEGQMDDNGARNS